MTDEAVRAPTAPFLPLRELHSPPGRSAAGQRPTCRGTGKKRCPGRLNRGGKGRVVAAGAAPPHASRSRPPSMARAPPGGRRAEVRLRRARSGDMGVHVWGMSFGVRAPNLTILEKQ